MAEPRFLKTSAGIFKVTINDDMHLDQATREMKLMGKLISVGGKNTCVFIKTSNEFPEAYLANVITREGGCEINDKKISGNNTIIMIKLAFTIVKEIALHVRTLKLQDTSSFSCELPNNKSFGINLSLYELAFHNATWYERHFNARIPVQSADIQYMNAKKGFNEPKPTNFDFNNNDLNDILMPIYIKTTTWKEFFSEIYKMEHKCRIMFPWYKEAIMLAMGGISYENQFRAIDIYSEPNGAIEYKEVKMGSRGGTRKAQHEFMEYIEPTDYILDNQKRISNEDIYKLTYTKADLKRKK